MPRPPLEATTHWLAGPGHDAAQLRIDFHRAGDRFAHDVRLLARDGAALACWSEIQRSDSPQWPASPPIQELASETIGGHDVLLGVGRAGKCHWSVSIEIVPIGELAALQFDIACRCPEEPHWLGSTYRTQQASALSVCCEVDTAIANSGSLVDRDGTQLSIVPNCKPQKWPGTVRWRYRIVGNAAPSGINPH